MRLRICPYSLKASNCAVEIGRVKPLLAMADLIAQRHVSESIVCSRRHAS
jgi:hypothetical protein